MKAQDIQTVRPSDVIYHLNKQTNQDFKDIDNPYLNTVKDSSAKTTNN